MTPSRRLAALGLELPAPIGTSFGYRPATRFRDLVFLAGMLPKLPGDVLLVTGTIGAEVSPDQAREAARLCALQALAWLADAAGGLDKVRKVLQLTAYLAVTPGFRGMSEIVDAASAVFEAVFAPDGGHSRSVVGVLELPRNGPILIDAVACLEV